VLQFGNASAAIVATTSLILSPNTMAHFSNARMLLPQASCRTFDAAADGFARAEGIAVIFINRLGDTIRNRSPIHAGIRGTNSNDDGRS
jgi:Polyketide synthase modules and related proteins